MEIIGYTLPSIILVFSMFASSITSEHTQTKEFVLTLDHTNFTGTINMHVFIVINVYSPRNRNCKWNAHEFEKAASKLSSSNLVFAKIDSSEKKNRELKTKYKIDLSPTILFVGYGGKTVEYYSFPGPKEADNLASYLKMLIEEYIPSFEIKSAGDAAEIVGDNKIVVVGVFPKLSGSEFDSFLATAEKLRSEFDFVHTSNPKPFPPKQPFATGPVVRLLKPFDEYFADSNDFDGEALKNFIIESSIPLITVYDKMQISNLPYVIKFFGRSNITKVMLFMNFAGEAAKSLNSKFREVAKSNKGRGLGFLIGNAETIQEVLEIYGVEDNQVPLIIINTVEKIRYLKTNVEVGQIESWFNDFKDGKLAPYEISQPIPTVNNEPVKVVVYKSLNNMVFHSGKNVLIEFYHPRCEICQKLAPVLVEVAVSYHSDPSVVIAKLDAVKNDVAHNTFHVPVLPTIYFRSASGNIVLYEGDMTKEDIISFIDKNKDIAGEPKEEKKTAEVAKDEL